jgi:hypothetical protein
MPHGMRMGASVRTSHEPASSFIPTMTSPRSAPVFVIQCPTFFVGCEGLDLSYVITKDHSMTGQTASGAPSNFRIVT